MSTGLGGGGGEKDHEIVEAPRKTFHFCAGSASEGGGHQPICGTLGERKKYSEETTESLLGEMRRDCKSSNASLKGESGNKIEEKEGGKLRQRIIKAGEAKGVSK